MSGPKPLPLLDRLLSKIEAQPNGCWLWTGNKFRDGYGQINIGGHMMRTHRAAYELFIGPIPEGKQIDHVKSRGCASRACCRPEHLEAVTQQENILRGAKTLHRDGYCVRGHERSAANLFYDEAHPGGQCRLCGRERCRAWRAKQKQGDKA